jgi:glycosyltransferase involved in cell wall biosynthesis
MSFAVREIELTSHADRLSGLENYEKVMILFRYRGVPVGTRTFPVRNGEFCFHYTDDLLSGQIRNQVLEIALAHYLDYEEQNANWPLPKATVAICTRNRAGDLGRCLEALSKLPDCGQEVLVIDNCPSDESSFEVVSRFPSFRYIREDKPGLDIARNKAMKEASHEIVAFIDDDAIPDPAWLKSLLPNFRHPMVMCVTGMTMPLELETEAQVEFERYSPFCKGFRHRRWNAENCNPVATGQVGAGANMAIRKAIVDEIGGFDEALDAGTTTQSGGDHEMFARILTRGYEIVYEPKALNWHRHRRTTGELKKAVYGYGSGVYAHWARTFAVEKEYSVLKLPVYWLLGWQLPRLGRSLLKRTNSLPADLLLSELKGCLQGIPNYYKARKKLKRDAR